MPVEYRCAEDLKNEEVSTHEALKTSYSHEIDFKIDWKLVRQVRFEVKQHQFGLTGTDGYITSASQYILYK